MDNRWFSFAKLVSPPTARSWSQAYNAGSLFVAVSLTKNPQGEGEHLPLSAVGKDLINSLEEEYFTLEEKNLASVQKAIETACAKLQPNVTCSLVAVSAAHTTLYVFTYGRGTVLLKRANKLGLILSSEQETHPAIISASGQLVDGDLIILETHKFTEVVPHTLLLSALKGTPDEIAEHLAPRVLEQEEGNVCGIFIGYKQPQPAPHEQSNTPLVHQTPVDESLPAKEEIPPNQPRTLPSFHFPAFSFPHVPFPFHWSRKKVLFFLVSLILIALLAGGVYTTHKKQKQSQTHSQFTPVYQQALKKYQDGQSLIDLNKPLARENLTSAKQILQKAPVGAGSSDEKQSKELQQKIDDALSQVSDVSIIQPTAVDNNQSPILTYERSAKSPTSSYAKDDSLIYAANTQEIVSATKDTQKEKTLKKNDSDWDSVQGVGVYNGNIYLLDTKSNQIYKFVPSGSDYSKNNYLSNSKVNDVSTATSMAIDGSVYVAFKDGSIKKFTKGKQEDFAITKLSKPLKSQTRMVTTLDGDNLYILDKENSRIVILSKRGVFLSELHASILSTAQDLDVAERDKKIYILSNGKVWELPLK